MSPECMLPPLGVRTVLLSFVYVPACRESDRSCDLLRALSPSLWEPAGAGGLESPALG